jgi:dTDP-4-amino-4,6-dideoxygalactose transaminase
MRETFLPYCKPSIGEDEIAAVNESLANGWLTTGPKTALFEGEFARISAIPHAVALNSCTAGLHLALIALGVGAGDEVVMPSLTFAAGAQCALELGARPVFCDVEPDTYSTSVQTIAAVVTRRTKAIIAMPYAGRPQGIAEICRFAREYKIAVIEDAAHGVGTLDEGSWPGAHGDAAIYSFYATKNLTTGEGGMFVSRDEGLARRVRQLSLHGMSKDAWQRYSNGGSWRYDVLEPGYKYNVTDIASSIGLVQLKRLPEMQGRRDVIARRYLNELSGLPGLSFQRHADRAGDRHSWCMFVVGVEARASLDRDAFVEALRARNIGTSVHYIPTHHFTAYRGLAAVPLPNTDALAARLLSLPLYPAMRDEDVDDVIEAVREICLSGVRLVPS